MATSNAPKLVVDALRADGWKNMYTALGDYARDKRMGQKHSTNTVTEMDAEDLWRGDAIAARIIEKPVRLQLKGGFDVEITDTSPSEEKPEAPDSEERMDSRQRRKWFPGKKFKRRSRRDEFPARAEKPDPEEVDNPKEEDKTVDPSDPLAQKKPESKLGEGTGADTDKAQEWSSAMAKHLKRLGFRKVLRRCAEYRKAYGGAAILLGLNDGEDAAEPVDLTKLESVDWLAVLRPREVWPASYYRDPLHEKFGEPKFYTVQRETAGSVTAPQVKVHASRVIRFDGSWVSQLARSENRGWGDNIFTRIFPVLADFSSVWASSSALMQDFAQAVFKMKGLAELLMQPGDAGTKTVTARATAIDMGRSVARAMLIDETEEFKREATPITGLSDLLDRWCNLLAAVADIPVTVLMGMAPAGLNATGDADIQNWYDTLEAEREEDLQPQVEYLVRLLFLSKEGPTDGVEPASWEIGWAPLGQLDELQEAERNLKQAQADKVYIDATVVSPEEVAVSRFGGTKYSSRTVLDKEARKVEPPSGANVPPPTLPPGFGGGKPGAPGAKPPGGKPAPGKPPFGGK